MKIDDFYADAENIEKEFHMWLTAGKADSPKPRAFIFSGKLCFCIYNKESDFLWVFQAETTRKLLQPWEF